MRKALDYGNTDKLIEFLESCVQEVFEEKRALYSAYFFDKISPHKNKDLNTESLEQAEWAEIDSLSKLRSIVGGRFQNLKSKWIAAGFPLAQSKKSENSEKRGMNQEAWLELSSWISNQGFEVRLSSGDDNFLFEIRQKKLSA